jgi:hypothetical protein
LVILKRLGKEIDSALLHSANRSGNTTAAADENDRQGILTLTKYLLYFQAVHLRHLQVEHNASGAGREGLVEEIFRRTVGLHLPTTRAQQSAYPAADTGVVVDQKNDGIRHAAP